MELIHETIIFSAGLSFLLPVSAAPLPVHAADVPENAYLFSYFINNGEDGLHLAWSADGLKWQALNDGKSFLKPDVGKSKLMRDPCVNTGPYGTFHMVWTSFPSRPPRSISIPATM